MNISELTVHNNDFIKAFLTSKSAISCKFGHILLFDIFTPSSIVWLFSTNSQFQKVKIKDGQEMDEGVKKSHMTKCAGNDRFTDQRCF